MWIKGSDGEAWTCARVKTEEKALLTEVDQHFVSAPPLVSVIKRWAAPAVHLAGEHLHMGFCMHGMDVYKETAEE